MGCNLGCPNGITTLWYGIPIIVISGQVRSEIRLTREDIKEVAKKYLNPNQRLILNYGPAKEKTAK